MSLDEGVALAVKGFDLVSRGFLWNAQLPPHRHDGVFEGCDQANTQSRLDGQNEGSATTDNNAIAMRAEGKHCLDQAMDVGVLSRLRHGHEGLKRFLKPAHALFVH